MPRGSKVSDVCLKCGITKNSGKHSCCVRGGAWFKYCGDAGDKQFEHTWAEGIWACEGFETSLQVQSPLQSMVRHVGITVYLRNAGSTAQPRKSLQQQQMINADRLVGTSSFGTMDLDDDAGHLHVSVCVSVLFVLLFLRT